MTEEDRPLVTATITTRHPEDYTLTNRRDGTTWTLDESGAWRRAEPTAHTGPPLPVRGAEATTLHLGGI